MNKSPSGFTILNMELLKQLIKWLMICLVIGIMAGSASALFLVSLKNVGEIRQANMWLIALLPLSGLLIGLAYYYWGKSVEAGNNLILDEYYEPKQTIPWRMAPMVLIGTLLTHLVGGSAGREGTAVQMSSALADQLTKPLQLNQEDRRILLIAGISAGFASVFGTPLAGAVFAIEVLVLGKIRFKAMVVSLLAAQIAHYVCHAWSVQHTTYLITGIPSISFVNFLWIIVAGIGFGMAALLFSKLAHWFSKQFKQRISYPPLRPVIGGVLLAIFFLLSGATQYAGLGVETIQASFDQSLPWYDSIMKTILTTFTLGAGFKGGEVTPLFFVGSTLGNAFSEMIPLPMALLAGMGFVAVFAGATNTPLACTIMAMELFGIESGVYMVLACYTAYFFSGQHGIYSSRAVGGLKYQLIQKLKSKLIAFKSSK